MDYQRRLDELEAATRIQKASNLELARTNAAYKARIQKLCNDISSLHRSNAHLIEAIAHHKKPRVFEQQQQLAYAENIPPEGNDAALPAGSPTLTPTRAGFVEKDQRGGDPYAVVAVGSKQPDRTTTPRSNKKGCRRPRKRTGIVHEPLVEGPRIKRHKSYALPSLKTKLRKGDPFTFAT